MAGKWRFQGSGKKTPSSGENPMAFFCRFEMPFAAQPCPYCSALAACGHAHWPVRFFPGGFNMHIAIIGSRSISSKGVVFAELDRHFAGSGQLHVVSGGARGADRIGAAWAISRGHRVTEILPDWKRFGRSAGFRRNHDIIAAVSAVVAIVPASGITPGTAHSIRLAHDAGLPVTIITVGPDQPRLL